MNREIELLKKENTPENVIEHSKAVCAEAMKIASNFDNVDCDLIQKMLSFKHEERPTTDEIIQVCETLLARKKTGYQGDLAKVKERGNVNDTEAKECAKIAESVYDKAALKEPTITNDVIQSAEGAGAKMYGLDFRMKQPTSMAGKIASDSKDDGVSFDQAGAGIKDAIRYTAVIPEDKFTDGYNQIKSSMEKKGYTEVRCKNFYDLYAKGESAQKAVQSVYKDKDGQYFEFQFHTPNSQGAKELNHPLYEEQRAKTTSVARAKELNDIMTRIGKNVSDPKGVMSIKSHK